MEMAGGVLLDDEAQRLRRHDLGVVPRRLGGLREVAHALVLGELAGGHGSSDRYANDPAGGTIQRAGK